MGTEDGEAGVKDAWGRRGGGELTGSAVEEERGAGGERNERAGHSRYRCCDCVCVSVKYD